jgi:hypothetical protein
MKQQYGEDHAETDYYRDDLASTLEAQKKWAESEVLRREAVAIARSRYGNEPAKLSEWLDALAETLRRQHKYAEAEPFLLESAGGRLTAKDVKARSKRQTFRLLVQLYEDWGRTDQAAVWRQQLDEIKKD